MMPREIKNVKFFTDWLNKKEGFDFVIDNSFSDEHSYIDVIIKSEKLNKVINIQNVAYRDGTSYGYAQSNINIPNFRPVFVIGKAMTDKERRASILRCIKDKEKKYQPSLVKDTLLLIEVTIPAVKPEQIKKLFLGGVTSNFKGIYFVQLPVIMPSADDKYGQSGFVYTLKPMNI